MFQISTNWLAVPEWLYWVTFVGSFLLIAVSLLAILMGLKSKRKKKTVYKLIPLVIGVVLAGLLLTHKIVSITMIGG